MNQPDESTLARLRAEMVDQQLRGMGIRDERVLRAMSRIPRHLFVPHALRPVAYEDCALPIGHGQTISQPFMVARMVEALELSGNERVLDVGTGSGYQAAVLSELAREVWSVEIVTELAEDARERLTRLGYSNVRVVIGDGSLGLPHKMPFDAIVVAAGAPEIPEGLVAQLAVGGRLVIPTGDLGGQLLRRVRKGEREASTESLLWCAFVPLVGKGGWRDLGPTRASPHW